jgi:hypothetical protein
MSIEQGPGMCGPDVSTIGRLYVVALAIVLSVVVLLLAVLVAGLLRSHADILKALHDLGVGVGEPGATDERGQGRSPWRAPERSVFH